MIMLLVGPDAPLLVPDVIPPLPENVPPVVLAAGVPPPPPPAQADPVTANTMSASRLALDVLRKIAPLRLQKTIKNRRD